MLDVHCILSEAKGRDTYASDEPDFWAGQLMQVQGRFRCSSNNVNYNASMLLKATAETGFAVQQSLRVHCL